MIALECFIKKDGKYLMLHRHPSKRVLPNVWMAPGGKREFNEGLFACARREILEETGMKIKNLKLVVSGNAHLEDLDTEVFFNFLTADWDSGELTPENDLGELKWLTPEEILKLDNLLSELKEVLPHVFSGDDRCISYVATYKAGNQMIDFLMEDPR